MASKEPHNPFDLAAIRATPHEDVVTERILTTVPVRRPGSDTFFRVHPDPEFSVDWHIVERGGDGTTREMYWVGRREFLAELGSAARLVRLFTCIDKYNNVFLWPAKLPTTAMSQRRWAESALEIAYTATRLWVRLEGNKGKGAYEMIKAQGDYGEPTWPDKSLEDLLGLAFNNGRVIDSAEHSVLRELRGEI